MESRRLLFQIPPSGHWARSLVRAAELGRVYSERGTTWAQLLWLEEIAAEVSQKSEWSRQLLAPWVWRNRRRRAKRCLAPRARTSLAAALARAVELAHFGRVGA